MYGNNKVGILFHNILSVVSVFCVCKQTIHENNTEWVYSSLNSVCTIAKSHYIVKQPYTRSVCYNSPNFVNSLPDNKFSDWSKLKSFTDDKIIIILIQQFSLGWLENIGDEGKMLVTSIFSFSDKVFKRLLYQGH